MSERLDVAIIGCGLSGLAAGIRLAHFGRRVCIFERHHAPGGLNGFYFLRGRKYDVGLHAVTNWVPPGTKGTPLGRILRQLRIDREELDLCPQWGSRIAFPGADLRFNNDPASLEASVAALFPAKADAYRRLVAVILATDTDARGQHEDSARARLSALLQEPLLEEMLLCPVMWYGSATERDLPWWSFAILFRSILLEGFGRPHAGVRQLYRVLLGKYRAAGGQRRMGCGVARIASAAGRATRLVLDDGTEVEAGVILSCAGRPETLALLGEVGAGEARRVRTGALSFAETIAVLDRQPSELGLGRETIVFFNDSSRFSFEGCQSDDCDLRTGVACFPSHYDYGPDRVPPEGMMRVTVIACHARWTALAEDSYRARKLSWLPRIQASAARFLPAADPVALRRATVDADMFTPRTVTRFTGRLGGAVYGSPDKQRDGATPLANVFLCGTDQGYLGIVGSMISGIAAANIHGLRPGS